MCTYALHCSAVEQIDDFERDKKKALVGQVWMDVPYIDAYFDLWTLLGDTQTEVAILMI